MKISYNWLKDYLDFTESPEEVSEILTSCGLEVESTGKYETVKGGLRGVLTAEVISCVKHPNADKLSLTQVNTGDGIILDIVCGAPNVAKGQKVLVATVGTTLWFDDNALEIKPVKIRGEKSEGMICAEDELGLGKSHEGILVLPEDTQVGIPASELFQIETDYVFEIGLTPNRADASSHIGVARDLAAAINSLKNTNLKVKIPEINKFENDDNSLTVEIVIDDTQACPRYSGLSFSNLKVDESPEWIKNRLIAVGIRPINSVVDISNYVLMECGQPLHAFDMNAVKGRKVIVRKPEAGTKFITLDEEERNLSGKDLMICNAEEAMCIAGVFGGKNSGVTTETKDVFLESAYFSPLTVRQTSKYHNLKTDASFRFERGADPNITVYALKRAAELLRQICGAKVSSEIIDVYPQAIKEKEIYLNYERLNMLCGINIKEEKVISILSDLGFDVLKKEKTGLLLSVPTAKVDVTREADIIEEVLRIYGFNNVPVSSRMHTYIRLSPRPDIESYKNTIAGFLAAKGYNETMNVSLNNSKISIKYMPEKDDKIVKLLNPLSRDLDSMRLSLVFNALENVVYNLNRRQNDLKLFEFGKVYESSGEESTDILKKYNESNMLSLTVTGRSNPVSWNIPSAETDIFHIKASVVSLLTRLGIDEFTPESLEITNGVFSKGVRMMYNGNTLCEYGTVSKDLLLEYDIKQAVYYAEFNRDLLLEMATGVKRAFKDLPKYPEVRRDLALVIDNSVTYSKVRELVLKGGGERVRSVNLFDVYEGEKVGMGKKSYAISLQICDYHKTLTDGEIDAIIEKVLKVLNSESGAVLR